MKNTSAEKRRANWLEIKSFWW